MLIADVMTKNPYHVTSKDPVSKAAAVMSEKNVNHLLVMDGGNLSGVLSVSDLPRSIKPQLSVFDVMTSHPVCVQASEDVSKARDIMRVHGVACLPVLEDRKIVGIITQFDVRHYTR